MDVIRNFRDYIASAPDELTAYCALLHGPDGSPLVGLICCYCGDLANGGRVLRPLRKFGSPILDGIQPMPFPAMQSLLSASFPDGNQNYWKSTLQRELPDEAISAIVNHANRLQSPLSVVVLESMAALQAEFRVKPPPIRTAICRGTFCSSLNGPTRRNPTCTAIGRAPARRCFGLTRKTRTCSLRLTSSRKRSSKQRSAQI